MNYKADKVVDIAEAGIGHGPPPFHPTPPPLPPVN